MIAHNHVRPVRTHRNIRTLRSLMTRVGPAQGNWSRVRESEALARRQRPASALRTASATKVASSKPNS